MKKNIWKTLLPITLVCLISGGIFYMVHQHQVKKEQEYQKMVKIATSKEAKRIYEEHMKANDPRALTPRGVIKSYHVDTKSLYYNPMGGMEVTVYVNGNKDLDFQFSIIEDDDGKLKSGTYTLSGKLYRMIKEESKSDE